ncbi:MAG TPA: KpsF/GutQ family sugar-phosphate isomerase [Candidatus Xenobia bacterium]|nr:KpsF/GutQ family sugar-phosphate isomerase [Candidatus Xenobia bacterium]
MSLEIAKKVLKTELEAIEGLLKRLDKRFEQAVELIFACQGRVVITGIGKSGIIGQKIAATFASTGTPAFFLHPAEAAHGDLGMLVKGDLLVALSYGGETDEINQLLPTAKRLGIPILALTGNLKSTLGQAAEVALDISVEREACPMDLTPTASTIAMMALGDALAIALLERRGFKEEDFARLHPGGRLGKKLTRVEALMHSGDAVPRVSPATPMPEVIYEMSRKGLGMTTVVEDSMRLAGIITDGDLRRLMERRKDEALHLTAADAMTANPTTIPRTELAGAALRLMEERKITSIVVVDAERRVEGVVHLHDLWTTQLF